MPKKLLKDSLLIELNSIDKLISEAIKNSDPIGTLQFKTRKELLLEELNSLEEAGNNVKASMALFFNGDAVFGSKGIMAKFAGNMLDTIQDLIDKISATEFLGNLGSRGKVPKVTESQLMITDVAHGSFGFILDEINDQQSLIETPLKEIVEKVAEAIRITGLADMNDFTNLVETLDNRTLIALRKFFKELDINNTRIKVVEDDKEFSLDNEAIDIGRERTEQIDIEENEELITARLRGFLPSSGECELQLDDETIIKSKAAEEAINELETLIADHKEILFKSWRISCTIRKVKSIHGALKTKYYIRNFVGMVEEDS